MAEFVIEVDSIQKSFGSLKAVRNFSFRVEKAECFGFLGPNGAGKTTMMKMIYGKALRDNDSQGRISVFGFDPAGSELEIKAMSGIVPQEDNLDTELNVIENLLIYSRLYGIPKKTALERIRTLLEFMELSEKSRSRINDLSGGHEAKAHYS